MCTPPAGALLWCSFRASEQTPNVYTIAKQRIFIRVRNEGSKDFLPDCVIRHILLHELAHTVNTVRGHGFSFRSVLHWLGRNGGVSTCGNQVPAGYNPCH